MVVFRYCIRDALDNLSEIRKRKGLQFIFACLKLLKVLIESVVKFVYFILDYIRVVKIDCLLNFILTNLVLKGFHHFFLELKIGF